MKKLLGIQNVVLVSFVENGSLMDRATEARSIVSHHLPNQIFFIQIRILLNMDEWWIAPGRRSASLIHIRQNEIFDTNPDNTNILKKKYH